mmetsp:Transcript_479/g.1663  ORF Transcript_479/g.1663 Transcript_479/m.1663 type:complete len:92 (-) Transcript_479:41-316(-)
MQQLASDAVAQRDAQARAAPAGDAAAAALQAQLQEREAAVAQLEMELKMVSSSLHALGLKVQREFSAGQPLQAASFEPLSFLGQRRAAAGM